MREQQRIGVIGCAAILPRVLLDPVKDIDHLQVYGLSSRTRSKAESYAKTYGVPVVYDSYDALLSDDRIHFVYILLCNDLHAEWIIRTLEAGKHVLVEKPLCLHGGEVLQIKEACQTARSHLLEGLMVQHHPWQQTVKEMIEDQRYGELRKIESRISFLPKENFTDNYRSDLKRGGGSFFDLGCYWLQFLQATIGLAPASFQGYSNFDGPGGCDWTFRTELHYPGGIEASLVTSFEMPYRAGHALHFEHAVVTLDDFFRANLGHYRISLKVFDKRTGETEKIVFQPQNYYVNQLRFFSDVIDGMKDNVSPESSFERILLQEKIYHSAR